MAVNKVIYGTTVLVDLTADTVTAATLMQGYTAHDRSGALITGTATGGSSSYTRTVVVPQQTVTVSSSTYTADNITMNSTLVVGDYYIVTLDGTEYVSTCGANWAGETYLGDSALLWYDGSGDVSAYTCPFAFERISWNAGGSLHATSGSHTVKVEHLEFVDGPLNLIAKSITSNGTYTASSDNADGYSSVTVNVSGGGGSYQAKTNISPTTSSQTITPDSGYDALSSVQINAMPTGTAGTPSATKGTVSNHSVSVTPSVTNTTGYITGGTKTGTAVTVSASELVSGSETKTANGTYDVTNLAQVVVDVQGGGSSSMLVDSVEITSGTSSSISFSGLKGEPVVFDVNIDEALSPSAQPTVVALSFDGTTVHGQTLTNTSNAQVSYSTSFTKSYSNGTLTITSNGPAFAFQPYFLTYAYGGSTSDTDTKDVQVGSGATSITFSGLEDEPIYWSCIFKSNFGTSSGYQRVIFVKSNGSTIIGLAMDSSAHPSNSYWTASYSNGSLTITSQGTNAGGYFHQPGYYQLICAYSGGSGNYQTKTVTPTTSAQEITADTGYDALKKVTVNPIPSQYIVPTGNISITSNTASGQSLDVSQYATATVNVQSGGSSKNVQVAQSTTRVANTAYTKAASLTCAVSGTYDVYWDCFRSTTSGTSGSQLYIGGSTSGSANTTFSNHAQNNHRTGVQINANQEVAVYVRSRGTNYYAYCGQLTIVQTA